METVILIASFAPLILRVGLGPLGPGRQARSRRVTDRGGPGAMPR